MAKTAISERLNYYGFSALLACLLSVTSYIILKSKDCLFDGGDYDKLAIIQITATVCGGVLFLLSFFNIAGRLYDIKVAFYAIVAAVIVVGVVLFYAVYIALTQPCILGIGQLFEKKNAFTAGDSHNIAIFFLDLVAGLTLLSIGLTFAKRM